MTISNQSMSTPNSISSNTSPANPFTMTNMLKWSALGTVALALLYVVWGLYLAGEPLFAIVILALCVGVVTIFGQAKYYTARFIFPAIAAIGIFIVLPVIYTSYIGFTNFGSRNLLSFERVTGQFLRAVSVDKSTERSFKIIADGENYQIFLTDGDQTLATQSTPLDGVPHELPLSIATLPDNEPLAMRDVIKLRTELAQVT
ncbi:MAG TPA: hypothetical protein ENK61_08915, partial [Devosia sp.]|nr:hypothetical protein [Devosia sp.]